MERPYNIVCHSVVLGDEIFFTEDVRDPRKSRRILGWRRIWAKVTHESYGPLTQQHTFSLMVTACEGDHPLRAGTVILRKGRFLYDSRVLRRVWDNEAQRKVIAAEKHERGDAARRLRAKNRDEPRKGVDNSSPFDKLRKIIRKSRQS